MHADRDGGDGGGDGLDELDRALGALRHDRHGFYGALGRDLVLRSLARSADDGAPDARTYRVLRFVDAQPPGTATIGQVAEVLLCDMARASRVVRRMVDDDLLAVRVAPGDARQRRLGLTARGARIVAAAADRRRAHLRTAVRDWPDEDVRTLTRLLRRLAGT